jgi:hypothetical protein
MVELVGRGFPRWSGLCAHLCSDAALATFLCCWLTDWWSRQNGAKCVYEKSRWARWVRKVSLMNGFGLCVGQA